MVRHADESVQAKSLAPCAKPFDVRFFKRKALIAFHLAVDEDVLAVERAVCQFNSR